MFDYNRLHELLESDLFGGEDASLLSRPLGADYTHNQYVRHSIHGSFYKKLAPLGDSTEADRAALRKFRERLPLVGLKDPSEPLDDLLLDYFGHHLARCLDKSEGISLAEVFAGAVPGPGSSLKQNFGSFFTKYFQGPLSCYSEDLVRYFRAAVSFQPSWAAAEWQRNLEFGIEIVDSSRVFFAKKDKAESRVCATEAGIDMLFQQGIRAIITDDLINYFNLDLTVQKELNVRLAQEGSCSSSSTHPQGFVPISTLDLTSASDSTSLELVNRYVPKSIRLWIMRCRAGTTILPDSSDAVLLPMVSTMGNAFTFPLMTAIFASIVRASYDATGLPFDKNPATRKWGVMGDDIIVPTVVESKVRRLLYLLGYEVNVKKSYSVGPFRESCGGDFFLGRNVRGVYIRSLETVPERYSAINRLNRWSATHGILLTKTVRYLLSNVPAKKNLVPRYEADDAGYHVPSILHGCDGAHYKALVPKVKQRVIPYASGEYQGYGDALYVAILGGYCKSLSVEVPSLLDSALAEMAWPEGRPEETIPAIAFSMRDPGGKVQYRARSRHAMWWDWPGENARSYDDSWDAVVLLNT